MVKFVLKFISVFLCLLLFLFVLANFQSLSSLILYHFSKGNLYGNSRLLFDFEKEKEQLKHRPQIVIPKIFLAAPLIFTNEITEKSIFENLKKGVVYFSPYKNLSKGAILFGHSSRPLWQAGKYDGAFLLLRELEKGDGVFLYLNQKEFKYEVFGKEIVSANFSSFFNKNFLDKNKKQPTLYLVTCWPPGTDLRRLVVEARYVK